MKLNTFVGFSLYLLGSFTLIALSLVNILPVNYLGGLVMALFIGGCCYAWLNATYQGQKMIKMEDELKLKGKLQEEPKQPIPQDDREDKLKEKEMLVAT